MTMFATGFTLEAVLALLRRRKWIGLSVFTILVSVSSSLIMFLPDMYSSQALVLVEGQQIPQEYVRATVTQVVERRLQAISQELLSRSQLEKLAEQFGLYKQLKKEGASSETVAKAMRRDIGINVISGRGARGDTVAFGVSYTSPDPQKAMQVANQLASLYVDANMRIRGDQAIGTSQFLAKQVEDVRVILEQQEEKVTAYKRQHMGELPEQQDANLRMIDALQQQMVLLSENTARARDRRNVLMQMVALDDELADLSTSNVAGRSGNSVAVMTPEQQLKFLRNQLTQLQVRFSDKHPDIIRLKQLITTLESEQLTAKNAAPNGDADGGLLERGSGKPAATKLSASRIELASIEGEIQRMDNDLRRVSNDIVQYQQRIENAPKIEQELLSITRDYNTTRENYASLLKRLDEAKLADKLEQNQKAEKFKILEPAYFPDKPVAPKRMPLFLTALIASLGVGLGAILLRELLDSSFHDVDDLRRAIKAPVLVTIPRIVTTTDLWRTRFRQGVGAAALALSVLVVIGVTYRMVANNEQLTRSFFSASANQLLRD
jgi:polysaccharide chain length determinant protein (PEP-CTERM system associated)